MRARRTVLAGLLGVVVGALLMSAAQWAVRGGIRLPFARKYTPPRCVVLTRDHAMLESHNGHLRAGTQLVRQGGVVWIEVFLDNHGFDFCTTRDAQPLTAVRLSP